MLYLSGFELGPGFNYWDAVYTCTIMRPNASWADLICNTHQHYRHQ